MMRLLFAPASPFVRKVTMTALIKGLMDAIALEHADTRGPRNAALAAANPLSKIPALVLADGTALYDSYVICEYLDSLAPAPVLFPPSGLERYRVLTRAALADGIMDAAVLQVYERRFRPEAIWSADWLARQQAKVDGGLDALEAHVAGGVLAAGASAPDYADIATAAALGYVDLRHGTGWRTSRPRLAAWLDAFAASVPAYGATQPTG
jgi:glutathione S-transferase